MKILLGFKDVEQGELVCRYIRSLDFARMQIRLTQVLDVWGSGISGIEPTPFNYEHYLKILADGSEISLKNLQDFAEKLGLSDVSGGLLYGNPANRLMDYSESNDCDLLAFGSSDLEHLGTFLAGGVVRKTIANSRKSLLIAKGSDKNLENISVVIATDHSVQANRWLDHFIEWKPHGLKNITLLTVLPSQFSDLNSLHGNMEVSNLITTGLKAANLRVLEKLKALGVHCESLVESGDVNEVIAKTMLQTQSDLLVLGSQGHGFMERLTIGSVALEQAIKHSYSVLIVREK